MPEVIPRAFPPMPSHRTRSRHLQNSTHDHIGHVICYARQQPIDYMLFLGMVAPFLLAVVVAVLVTGGKALVEDAALARVAKLDGVGDPLATTFSYSVAVTSAGAVATAADTICSALLQDISTAALLRAAATAAAVTAAGGFNLRGAVGTALRVTVAA
uniref:Uncharacterized protein n=1 Tax=Triticum urartu TaxID=4572 RepID=A0A8R7PLW3_TRIUA